MKRYIRTEDNHIIVKDDPRILFIINGFEFNISLITECVLAVVLSVALAIIAWNTGGERDFVWAIDFTEMSVLFPSLLATAIKTNFMKWNDAEEMIVGCWYMSLYITIVVHIIACFF